MTITDVFEVFDILQDKYGAPYFPTDWKVRLFNQAQYDYLNEVIPDNQGGKTNLELDSNVTQNLKPVIYPLTLNTTSGVVTNTAIELALASASHAGAKVLRLLAIRATNDGTTFYPVRYAKHNNIWAYYANSLKTPTAPNKMRWTLQASGYQFHPTSDSTTLLVTVLKHPRAVSVSPNVDPEWDDYVVSKIIELMLDEAQVATRDAELSQAVQAAMIRKQ